MALFYFDTFDGEEEITDVSGIECNSRDQIESHAVSALPDIARDELPDGLNRTFWVKVRDAKGKIVFESVLVLNC